MKYYAIKKGRKTGIFNSWEEVFPLVNQYPNASYKKFTSVNEAQKFIDESNLSKSSSKNFQNILNENIKNKIINVYCDGSTFNNGKKNASGGIGILFDNNKDNIFEPFLLGTPTNQKTELYALIRTLEVIGEKIDKREIDDEYQFHIYTDSQYTINCITWWIPNWIKNNWIKKDGQKVKNIKLLKQLNSIHNKYKSRYKIFHIGSHGKSTGKHAYGNSIADNLAKKGSQLHPNYLKQNL